MAASPPAAAPPAPAAPLCPQVHKINVFTQAQTASLDRRLAKLQDKADGAETAREKEALLEVRGGAGLGVASARCCWRGAAAGRAVRLVQAARQAKGQPVGLLGCNTPAPPTHPLLVQEAKAIGDEFLQLEKYVNLNYMGFHKVGWVIFIG